MKGHSGKAVSVLAGRVVDQGRRLGRECEGLTDLVDLIPLWVVWKGGRSRLLSVVSN